jgi:hypothetical protein
VSSSDGSVISRPWSMISEKVRRQAVPKWMLWWAMWSYRRVDPACSTTADGE